MGAALWGKRGGVDVSMSMLRIPISRLTPYSLLYWLNPRRFNLSLVTLITAALLGTDIK